MHTRRVRSAGTVLLLSAALVLTACGDDDDEDSSAGSAPSGAALAGAPIEIGFSNTENSPAGNYVDSREGAEAAIEYINNELGGVNGRPLELESCVTNGSPETAVACANKFVEGGKVAVVPGIDLSAPGGVPIYTQAGMPYVGGLPLSASELTAPNGFTFIGAAAGALAGTAAYVGQVLKAKKVAYMSIDVPQASAAVDSFLKPVLSKTGVTDVNVVLESATSADFTPSVTKASSGDPDAIIMAFGGPACVKAMQAVAQTNVPRDKVIFVSECANKEQIEAGNGGGDGAVYQTSLINLDSDEPNAKIFREKMSQYSDAEPGVTSANGFDSIMNLYSVMKDMGQTEITRESMTAALKAANNHPAFLSHGFTCDGQQFPGLNALCDTNVRFLKYDNGKFVDTDGQWIDGAAVLTGG